MLSGRASNRPSSSGNLFSSLLAIALLSLFVGFTACGQKQETPVATPTPTPAAQNEPAVQFKKYVATIETEVGTIKIDLLSNESPRTVENFRQLATRGYYNGLIFHRTIDGFMIQGGDPKGDGSGGDTATGNPLPNEINPRSPVYSAGYQRGVVAMANKGTPETASSQFFIMHKDNTRLPPVYTIFGRVTEGIEVVDKIASGPVGGPRNDRPNNPIKMKKVTIE